MADLGFAVKEKVTPDHDVIDEAIREEAEVRIAGRRMLDVTEDTRDTPSSRFLSALCTDPTAPKSRT